MSEQQQMLDFRELEKTLVDLKEKFQKKKDEVLRASATKDQLEENLKVYKRKLAELGIKNVEDPSDEIAKLEEQILASVNKIKEIMSGWE